MANGITAEQAIQAIKDSRGFVTTIAKKLGCSRMTVYNLAEKYATVKAALEEEREGLKDFAEGKLLQQIDAGNVTAIIFYLKTQAKGRGYIERQEVSAELSWRDKLPPNTNPDDVIQQFRAIMQQAANATK